MILTKTKTKSSHRNHRNHGNEKFNEDEKTTDHTDLTDFAYAFFLRNTNIYVKEISV